MDNWLKVSDMHNDVVDNDEQMSFFKISDNKSINESNLMTLPFIWLKRKSVNNFKREWVKSNGDSVSLEVSGGKYGVPQIAELDVLLALFRIHLRNNKNGFYKDLSSKKTYIPKRIYFTFLELSKELGYKTWGGEVKKNLEKSIIKLNETVLYSGLSIKDAETNQFVTSHREVKSFRILENYYTYEKKMHKKEFGNVLKSAEVKDYQFIEINDFFLNNMCNDYYKVYDYEMYKQLKMSISKKLFLILSMWSKSPSKFLSYNVIFDYVGLNIDDKKERYFQVKQVKKAMQEYVNIGYIDSFNERNKEGIEIIYSQYKLDSNAYKKMFKTEGECVEQLRKYNIQYSEMGDLINKNGIRYTQALLRYMEDMKSKNKPIHNAREFVISAINKGDYNLKKFMD